MAKYTNEELPLRPPSPLPLRLPALPPKRKRRPSSMSS